MLYNGSELKRRGRKSPDFPFLEVLMNLSELPLKYEERIIFQLRQLYQQYGYAPFRMSKFEEYELYARNKKFLVSEQVLTFTDTDGKLMALKPDVTLSIIKNRQDGAGVDKLYYNENVYRTAPTSRGYREIMQVGLECIGDLDVCAVSEVLLLAARSLEIIRKDYLLDLSHMGVVSGLLEEMGWTDRGPVLELIARKNLPGIWELCGQQGKDPALTERLCRLTELYGTPEQVLPVLETMTCNPQMEEGLRELREVCSLLEGCRDNLRLDFSAVNDMHYYNGIIFRGWLPGLAAGVLTGGRYDNLLHRMGKQGGAIGFAVYMDQLERFNAAQDDVDVDVLLLYDSRTDPRRLAEQAEALRQTGASVRIGRTIPEGLRFRKLQEVR